MLLVEMRPGAGLMDFLSDPGAVIRTLVFAIGGGIIGIFIGRRMNRPK